MNKRVAILGIIASRIVDQATNLPLNNARRATRAFSRGALIVLCLLIEQKAIYSISNTSHHDAVGSNANANDPPTRSCVIFCIAALVLLYPLFFTKQQQDFALTFTLATRGVQCFSTQSPCSSRCRVTLCGQQKVHDRTALSNLSAARSSSH
jgi:hypothetical protein